MRTFGLIGFPLTHSFSEKYFTEKFRREGIDDAEFRLSPLEEIELLPELIAAHPGLGGLGATVPWKEKVIRFLDSLDATAKAVGAVNCIRIDWETQPDATAALRPHLTGFNTDIHGFRQSLKPFLASHHERALILGTGGASKAVAFVLREIGVECVFVSREKKEIPGHTVLTYHELNSYVMDAFRLIVNCTPVGTFPQVNEAPAIPYELVTPNHFLYDLVYNPAETKFLEHGKTHGALTLNGYDMLKMQAEKAWENWNA